MPDRLTWRARTGLRELAVLLLCVIAAVLVAVVVYGFWSPAKGMVYQGAWQRGLLSVHPLVWTPEADESVFTGTALFALTGLAAGVVIGAVAGLLAAGRELLTLVVTTIGSLGAGFLAYALVVWRAPASPQERIRVGHVADGTMLRDTIHLASPWLALVVTGGALLALGLLFLMVSGPETTASRDAPESPFSAVDPG